MKLNLTAMNQSQEGLLLVVVTALVLSAGCNGLNATQGDAGTEVSTNAPPTLEPTSTPPATGADLREITLKDESGTPQNGELDRSDPADERGYYEPITFSADAGTVVNITIEAQNGSPILYLYAPNESVITITDSGRSSTEARVAKFSLPDTGEYTIFVASANPDDAFAYSLTIEEFVPPSEREELFAGDPSNWNRTEQLGEFALDYADTVEENSNYTSVSAQAVGPGQDYIVMTYRLETRQNFDNMTSIDGVILLTHSYLDSDYRKPDNNLINKSWTPDRIYHRIVTSSGTLFRVAYTDAEWAREYYRSEELDPYLLRYLESRMFGPAHPAYVAGANNSTRTGEIATRNESSEIEIS